MTNELTTDQKMLAMNDLSDGKCALRINELGWLVSIPNLNITEGPGSFRNIVEHGATPEEAISNAWVVLTDLPDNAYIVRNPAHKVKWRAYFRWSGFMWQQVTPHWAKAERKPKVEAVQTPLIEDPKSADHKDTAKVTQAVTEAAEKAEALPKCCTDGTCTETVKGEKCRFTKTCEGWQKHLQKGGKK